MTTDTGRYDDETLMAFADGELSADEMARIRRAMHADPALAARVDLFAQTKAQARGALKVKGDDDVPLALRQAVERMVAEAGAGAQPQLRPTGASSLPAANDTGRSRRWAMPLAASLVAALAGAIGYMVGMGAQGPSSGVLVAGLDNAALPSHLASTPSGAETPLGAGGPIFRAIGTFEDGRGVLCREFELVGQTGRTISIACRDEGVWNVAFAVTEPAASKGYVPASSLESLDAYLDGIGATPPLSPQDERAALALDARQ